MCWLLLGQRRNPHTMILLPIPDLCGWRTVANEINMTGQYPFLLSSCNRNVSPAVLLLMVNMSFPCSHLSYSLQFKAAASCTIYQWLSKCINRSYPRHSNLDVNIQPPQCKGPCGDWEGEIGQQYPAKYHYFWFLLTIELLLLSFVCLGLFWEQAKELKEQAKSILHTRLVMQTKLWICLQQRRIWRTVWCSKPTRKQDETSTSRFLHGEKGAYS